MEDGYEVYQYVGYCDSDPNSAAVYEYAERVAILPANSTHFTFTIPAQSDCFYFMGVFVVATKDGGHSEAGWLSSQ